MKRVRSNGFTLIEVTVTLMIIAFAFIPIFNLFRFGSSGTTNNINEIIATNYASDLINCVREIPYATLKKIVGESSSEYEESELEAFFEKTQSDMPKMNAESIQSSTVEYSRKLNIDFYDGKPHGIIASFFSKILKQQTIPSYLITVTVNCPKVSGQKDEKIILYSIVAE